MEIIEMYIKNWLWQNIVIEVRNEVQNQFKEIYGSLDFGAYIAPKDYFVSYIFKTTAELHKASESGLLQEINNCHKKCLRKNEYPIEAIEDCTFASQEECDKRFHGNWYYYYK